MRTEKFNLCKSTKKLLTLITLLTLGVGQMGAITITGGKVYYNDALTNFKSTHNYLACLQSSYFTTTEASNAYIDNTKLLKFAAPNHSGWSGENGICFFTSTAEWGNQSNPYSTITSYSSHYTASYAYDLNNSNNYYLFTPSSSSNGCSITGSWNGTRDNLFKLSNTIAVKVKKIGSGSYTTPSSTSEMPATSVSVTAYYLNGDATSTSNTVSLSGSTYSNTFYGCPGGKITLSQTAKTGYQFDGYYISSTSITSPYYPTSASAITIEARYTEVSSTVSLVSSPASKGTFTVGGAAATSTTAGVTTTRSVTAVPISGYHFVSWAITGGATISSTTTNPTTVTGGGAGTAATLTATFAADDVYTLTVAAGTGISAVTGTTNNIKAGDNIAITATVATGYTWSTWTKTGTGTLSTFTAGTKNQTVTVGTAGDMTLTASATETMRTITINGGTAASTSAGVSTTGTATAAAPAAGKKFTGWTLGSGVTLSGGSLTDRTINFTATANSSVTANYANRASVKMYFAKPTTLSWGTLYAYAWKDAGGIDPNADYPGVTLSTTETINCITYYVYQYYTEGDGIGGAATGKAGWDRIVFGCNNDSKKTADLTISNGHYYYRNSSGTGKAAAITSAWYIKGTMNSWGETDPITHNCATNSGSVDISLTTGSTWEFKVYNEVNDQMWSNSTACGQGDGITATMASAETLYNNDANVMKITPALNGTYTFTVGSTNASNPTIKVAFPEIYAIAGSFNSWSTEANPLSMDGNTGTADIVLAPSGSNYTLKVVDDGAMYGKNSTTITGTTTVSGLVVGQSDIALTADIYPASANPSYSFSYNKSTKALTVTYPAAHTVTYGVGTHAGTTSVTSSISVASGKKILDTQSITFSKGDTKTGYTWKGWYNNTSGSSSALGTGATYTSSSRAANTSVYACYNLVTYTITYNLNGGSNPVSPAPATSFTIESAAITLPTPSKTGYTFNGWYENADLSTGGVKTTIPAGSTGNKVYYAKWTPITYTIHFNGNGNTSGSMSNQTGVTYDSGTTITANAFVKTGYNFAGWATTQERANAGTVDRTDGAAHGNLASTQGATAQLWAVWTPKTCTVTFDYQTSAEGYGAVGTLSSVTATYDASMPALSGNMPTAANGYCFMGFFSETGGNGTKYYNADKSSAHNWDVNTTSTTTLYAYYKKAEITGITFTGGNIVSPSTSTSVTAVIEPTPVAPTTVCWRVLYNNDNPLAEQPTFTPASGASVSFTSPEASGTYKLEAVLHTGAGCGGTELSTYVATFQVAGDHTVTILYQDASGNTIKASESMIARPLSWSDDITAPDIFGYTFDHWYAQDGVYIKANEEEDLDDSEIQTIKIRAIYDGRLVAKYTQKSMIYFKNTLNWENVYVNFLDNNDYWNNPKGSGNESKDNCNKTMTRLGETDIWYYDYGAESINPTIYVSFTSESQNNYKNFYGTSVVYPAHYYQDEIHNNHASENGFKAATPMFVPLAGQTKTTLNSNADYYNRGYWTKFTPGTGYVLEIYNTAENALIKSIEFTSENDLMPMKAVADLEAGVHYKYQIRRGGTGVNGCYLGTSKTGDDVYMSYTDHTAWQLSNSSFHMLGVITTAAGNYTFTLAYANTGSNDDHRFRITVDYPASAGDFQILYNDRANWSQSAAHSATWIHPSRVITARPNGVDTISFYVYKHANTALTARQVSSINASTGAITWAAANIGASASMSLSGVAATGVYNFVVTQNATGTAISSIENIGEYTGNYYIRTDAANSKWDNYTTDGDHLMTYSEYSIEHGGYSHYYCHWVKYTDTGRKNVKFCIANDYSPCISDTLTREDNTDPAWTNINNYIEASGDLLRDANVRYMWNIATNKLSRAYVDGAQNAGSEFLLMLNTDATDKIRWADESALTDKKVTFSDNENWIYEADIQAQPNAQIRLKSTWGETNVIEQYFKGSSSTSETLIGGSGSTWYDIRLLYDFKTNRLVAAYKPSGNITDETAINADIMFIREHQGDISQLTFSGSGSITDIKTAYGVIRFNKWVLNNREPSGNTHGPLAEPKSLYERSLFWISFPFRVKLSEVFGFGTYGSHWAIQYYDGADRAARGHFLENGTFWKWLNRSTAYLEPNQGYLLAIDVDLLGINSDVWGPESRSEQIELYFPSTGNMPNLTSADVVQTIPEHTCTINRAASEGLPDTGDPRTSYNRTIFDSHWNVLSVPTYVNTDDVTFANTDWTTEGPGKRGPNFLYTWNSDDNTITATAASGYTYHAMHSYMVQYCNTVTWAAKSGSPYTIVARKTYEEAPREIEFRLEIQQNEKMIDRTYVVLSNDEEVSANFAFGEDMVKEFNARKAAIFNYTADNVGVAGNTMPMSEQTTVIPVGLEIPTAGEYTFAIPDGTEGVGVILVDNVANTRTNLSALDYTVNLTTGTHDGRFVLEISPIHNATTGIEAVSDEGLEITGARKMIIDQKLYIVKDGKLFDATGKRVE